MSLPLWERGLKYHIHGTGSELVLVAPLVGAWIEIRIRQRLNRIKGVAPLVGAWIEILFLGLYRAIRTSRSPCGSVD